MQDQPSPRDAAAELDQLERVVIDLLLEAAPPGLISEAEVGQAIGSDMKAAHALVSLHADGLIHRLEEFVFPTRAAARFHQLDEVG